MVKLSTFIQIHCPYHWNETAILTQHDSLISIIRVMNLNECITLGHYWYMCQLLWWLQMTWCQLCVTPAFNNLLFLVIVWHIFPNWYYYRYRMLGTLRFDSCQTPHHWGPLRYHLYSSHNTLWVKTRSESDQYMVNMSENSLPSATEFLEISWAILNHVIWLSEGN